MAGLSGFALALQEGTLQVLNCVITYRHQGKWKNFYTPAKSIEAAEAVARLQGIRGEGFELIEEGEL